MPVLKRRLDICGRERVWEYTIELGGLRHKVTARSVGRSAPTFVCSCGCEAGMMSRSFACAHIAEARHDWRIAEEAAANMR